MSRYINILFITFIYLIYDDKAYPMDNEKQIIEMLEKKYKTFLLSKKELAQVMSISISGIDNLLSSDSPKIPKHIKMGQGSKSAIRFSVIDVARFLVGTSNVSKVA